MSNMGLQDYVYLEGISEVKEVSDISEANKLLRKRTLWISKPKWKLLRIIQGETRTPVQIITKYVNYYHPLTGAHKEPVQAEIHYEIEKRLIYILGRVD